MRPEPRRGPGRPWRWRTTSWKLGAGSCPRPAVRLCGGQRPGSGTRQPHLSALPWPLAWPLVITEESVAAAPGPRTPPLLAAFGQGVRSGSPASPLTELFDDRHREICKDLTIHKYLLNTYSVPGPEPAPGNPTKIPIYSSQIGCKGKLSVMGKKREHFPRGNQRRPWSRERDAARNSARDRGQRRGPREAGAGKQGALGGARVRWAQASSPSVNAS